MPISFCRRYLSAQEIIVSEKIYSPQFNFKLEGETQFLSGDRSELLQKMFAPKTHKVGSVKKLYVEIGLQVLKIKDIKEGRTKGGYKKMTVSFYKKPNKEKSNLSYDTINTTHMMMNETTGRFSDEWFRPFTRCFTKADFKRLPKGKELKAVVAHKEEMFILKGEQVLREKGMRAGEPIILTKPEIVAVYHIDTPDEDIKFKYSSLYIPIVDGQTNN